MDGGVHVISQTTITRCALLLKPGFRPGTTSSSDPPQFQCADRRRHHITDGPPNVAKNRRHASLPVHCVRGHRESPCWRLEFRCTACAPGSFNTLDARPPGYFPTVQPKFYTPVGIPLWPRPLAGAHFTRKTSRFEKFTERLYG
jgi:hypothetical protein